MIKEKSFCLVAKQETQWLSSGARAVEQPAIGKGRGLVDENIFTDRTILKFSCLCNVITHHLMIEFGSPELILKRNPAIFIHSNI
ncbi:MAG: hypothetical protein ACREOO_11275 [bacterium]